MNKNIAVVVFSWIIFSNCLVTSIAAQTTEKKSEESSIILRDRSNFFKNTFREQIKDKDNLTKTLIIVGLVSTVGLVGWRLSRQGNAPVIDPMAKGKGQKNTNKALIDQVNPKLRRKLLRLINDPKTANRLLMGIHKHNRNRSPNWLAEKAIYDLRRGR